MNSLEFMFKVRVRVQRCRAPLCPRCGPNPLNSQLLEDHPDGCVVLRVAEVQRQPSLLEGLVTFTGKHNNKVVSNLPDSVLKWKMRFFYARLKEAGGGGLSLSGESLIDGERDCLTSWKPQSGSGVLPFSQPQMVLIEGDLFLMVSGLDVLWCSGSFRMRRAGGASACEEGRLRKKRHLKKAIREGQGPEEEEERLARREVTDLHAELALSHEEVRRSGVHYFFCGACQFKASGAYPFKAKLIYSRTMEPVDSMPVESVHVVDVKGDFASPLSVSGRVPFVRTQREATHCHGIEEASTDPKLMPQHGGDPDPSSSRGLGGDPLGDVLYPFDIEARALKILSDLLLVSTWREEALQSRAEETLVGLLKELDAAKFEQELSKEIAAELLAELDAAKAEQDEALNEAKGGILAKRDLERALEEATAEVTRLFLQKLNAEASICLFYLGAKEAELLAKLEESQAKIMRLQAELEAPRAEPAQLRVNSSEGAEGDASGQASRPLSGESRALIISGYLCNDAHRQRDEFKNTHYARGGFVKSLLEVEALYPKLDLSSLYGSS
ncbi:hypothetical protein ACLOJK_028848 [Asimina triloba]